MIVHWDTGLNQGVFKISTLQEQLDRLIQRKGEQDPLVQMLRNQITAEKSGKNFQELYTGSAEKAKPPRASQPDLSVLPFKGDWPGGVLVQGELLKSFERVLRGLKTRRKTNIFYGNVDELFNWIDEGYLNDVGERLGDGLPLGYLQAYLNDGEMASQLGISEEACSRVTNAERAKFARDRLLPMQSSTDADLCPGFWSLLVTDGQSHFFLGFSVAGYSFSGVEWRQEGAFLSEADFIKKVCCQSKMLFENCLCVKGVPTRVEKIDDATLLRLVWGRQIFLCAQVAASSWNSFS